PRVRPTAVVPFTGDKAPPRGRRARGDAAAEPLPASDRQYEPTHSPASAGGIHRARCSSEPNAYVANTVSVWTLAPTPTDISARAISSMAIRYTQNGCSPPP